MFAVLAYLLSAARSALFTSSLWISFFFFLTSAPYTIVATLGRSVVMQRRLLGELQTWRSVLRQFHGVRSSREHFPNLFPDISFVRFLKSIHSLGRRWPIALSLFHLRVWYIERTIPDVVIAAEILYQ